MMEAALAAEDAKQARRPVKRKRENDKDEDEAGKGARDGRALGNLGRRFRGSPFLGDGAACTVLVPARGGEPHF